MAPVSFRSRLTGGLPNSRFGWFGFGCCSVVFIIARAGWAKLHVRKRDLARPVTPDERALSLAMVSVVRFPRSRGVLSEVPSSSLWGGHNINNAAGTSLQALGARAELLLGVVPALLGLASFSPGRLRDRIVVSA